jgi:hypothetical protein
MERPNLFSSGDGSANGLDRQAKRGGLDCAEIKERLESRSQGMGRESARGDHELNPGMMPVSELRAAAVLVPLVDRPGGVSVLLTRRTEHLARHPGQIAFPGGRIEKDDAGSLIITSHEPASRLRRSSAS